MCLLTAGILLACSILVAACHGKIRIQTPFFSTLAPEAKVERTEIAATDIHAALFEEENYPSARTCARCHPDHYAEWSVSPHAYAQLSPVFNAMQGAINHLTNGTFGDFCIRCHSPVGMNLNEPTFLSNDLRHPASREGITCIACHRVNETYGKISGRFDVQRGKLFDPVYGPSGNKNLKSVLEDTEATYGPLSTKEGETGTPIHTDAQKFWYLTEPGFCGTCHDVTLGNGFRLEEAFSEYKTSPAAKKGVTCQDCHMGKVQGIASGYREEPAARVNGVETPPRKRTDHMFPGPDYSIIHPGLFPHVGEEDLGLANMGDWLKFDWKAGWGEKEFEKELRSRNRELRDAGKPEVEFPAPWDSRANRKKARELLDRQFALLERYREKQLEVLRNAYQLGEKRIVRANDGGIEFHIEVRNATEGHNAPTGFIAERSLYLEVTVSDAEGAVVFRSGDTDPNGDVRDLHSLYVHNGALPRDTQLFSLQSKFIVRLLRGGEREQVLAINHSATPLPFLRPARFSTIAVGGVNGARIHRQGIEPLGHRWAKYRIEADELTGKWPYKARVRMISGMVPPNLIDQIGIVGFNYGMSARSVADAVVAGRATLYDEVLEIPKE